MLKYTELVEQIESLMDDPEAYPTEIIAELAFSYREACEWVNEKSRICVDIIRQGNAAEALQLCRQLDLLENYQTLLIDGYDDWVSVARTFGEVVIPPFNRRIMDELDSAMSSKISVEELLEQHRSLALSGAPLTERIPILRKLVELVPDNADWKKELQEYESARLEALYEELPQALTYEDCARLINEIEEAKWSVEIPFKIRQRMILVRQEYQKINRQKQLTECNAKLSEIADKLLQSYNALDFEEANRLRGSWFDVLNEFQELQLIPPYDLIHSVDEVMSWIDCEQERLNILQEFNEKVASVDRELKPSMSVEKCQRLLMELSQCADSVGQPVPERFQRFLDNLIEKDARKTSERRRHATKVVVVLLLAFIGAASFGAYEFIQWYRFNSSLNRLSKYQLAVSRDRNALQEAYQFALTLESSGYQLDAYPEAQANIAYIKKVYEEDAVRHEDWKLLHDKIERSVKKGEATCLDEIDELERLSVLKEEKAAFAVVKQSNYVLLKKSYDEYVKLQNDEFQKIQQDANELLQSDDSDDVVKLREIETKIIQIKQSFKNFAQKIAELQSAAKRFETRCDELLSTVQDAIQKSNMEAAFQKELDELVAKLASPAEYVQALQAIVDQNENPSYASDFTDVIQRQEIWGRAYVWNDYAAQNLSVFQSETSFTVDQLKDFVDKWNAMPFKPQELSSVKTINNRIPYYQSMIDCDFAEALKPLSDLCDMYSQDDFWYYEASDGKRYYFNKKPSAENGMVYVNYMKSLSEQSDNQIPVELSTPIDPLKNKWFVKKIRNLMNMINDNTRFTECGIRILDVIYQDTLLRDPVIKYQFMVAALKCFTKSRIIHEGFGIYLQQLDNANVLNCNPFRPENESLFRTEADRMLGRLKDYDKCVENALNRNEQLGASIAVEIFQPVGFLDINGSQWTVRGIPDDSAGELCIITQSGVVSIGTVQNNEIKLNPVSDSKRGEPVFLIKPLKQ